MSQLETDGRDPTGGGSDAEGAVGAPPTGDSRGLDDLLERVFVAPRVVDQRAFDDMSATLRSLVKDAASQNRMLLGATGDVRGLGEQLRAASKELEERVRAAAGTLPAIDERSAKAEQLLGAVREELSSRVREFRDLMTGAAAIDRSQIERDIRERVRLAVEAESQERLAAFSLAIDQAVESAMTKLHDARHNADRATAQAQQAEARAAAVLEQAGVELGRLEDAIVRLREVSDLALDKAEGLRAGVAAAEERIELSRNDLDAAAARLILRIEEGLSRVEPAMAGIEARGVGILDRLRTQLAEAAEHAAVLEISTAEKAAADLADAVERATEAALELRELTAGIGQHREQAEAATRTFATMASQAQQAGGEVGNRILAAAEWIEGLDKNVATLESRARGLLDDAARRVETLEQVQAAVARAHEVGPRLAQLVQRADAVGRGLDRVLRDSDAPPGPGSSTPG